MFKSHQLFSDSNRFINANITALEYKEISIAFDRALKTLQEKPGIAKETIQKAIYMKNKAEQRYNSFVKENGLSHVEFYS